MANHPVHTQARLLQTTANAGTETGARLGREARLLTCAAGLALLLCAYLGYTNRQARTDLRDRAARSNSLATDLLAIQQLRDRPQQIRETGVETGDLLEHVSKSMQEANLPPHSLVSTQPQPPRPIPGTAVVELNYRLIFTDVTLEALTRFADACQHGGTYRVSGIVLRAAEEKRWNVDLIVGMKAMSAPAAREQRTERGNK